MNIFFSEQWGKIWENIYNGIWETYYTDNPYIVHVYIKKPIYINDILHYELISPYYVNGFYYNNNVSNDDIQSFLMNFKKHCIDNNYISEFVRFTPHIPIINIFHTFYSIELVSKYYYIDLTKGYDYYINNAESRHRCCVKHYPSNYIFNLNTNPSYDDYIHFMEMYNQHMKNIHAKDFYIFPESFYKNLLNINCILAHILCDNNIISSSIFIEDNKYIYYFLSCKNNSYKKTHNIVIDKIIQYGISNNLEKLILGGGITPNDSLDVFKRSITKLYHPYYIGKCNFNV